MSTEHSKKGRYAKRKSKNAGSVLFAAVILCASAALILGFHLMSNRIAPNSGIPVQPFEETTLPVVTEKTAWDHYAPLLDKYRLCLEEGWTEEQCQMEGISSRFCPPVPMGIEIGYSILDINADGREELLIGHGIHIWDLYATLEDGVPVQLLSDQKDGWQFYLGNQQTVCAEYFSKEECMVEYYHLEEYRLVMQEQLQYRDNEWMREGANQEWDLISEQDAQNLINSMEKIRPEWIPIDPDANSLDADTWERYLPVLEKYTTALLEKWDMEKCWDNEICYMITWLTETPEELGVCFLDLDGDDIQELLIVNDSIIYDLYTLKDGAPVLVLSGGERNSYRLCQGNFIINHGSGSAFWSVFNSYLLRQGDLILVDSVISDYLTDPDNPWYRSPNGEDLGEPLTEDEANAIRDAYIPAVIAATPILELE